jgi:hypothetical protein
MILSMFIYFSKDYIIAFIIGKNVTKLYKPWLLERTANSCSSLSRVYIGEVKSDYARDIANDSDK